MTQQTSRQDGRLQNARQKDLEDKTDKLRSAQKAVAAPDATERDKSDLKMIEQDLQAHRQKMARKARSGGKPESAAPASLEKQVERKLDKALEDSFPGSDPVSFIGATPVNEGDRKLADVEANERQAAGKRDDGRRS